MRGEHTIKLMCTFSKDTELELKKEAELRNISVQELMRAVIIPEWAKQNGREVNDNDI